MLRVPNIFFIGLALGFLSEVAISLKCTVSGAGP